MYKLHEGYEKMENEVSEILKPENKFRSKSKNVFSTALPCTPRLQYHL